MFPYFTLVGIPLVANFFMLGDRGKKKNRFLITIFFVLYFLLLALRSEEIGIDLTNYKSIYINWGKSSWKNIFSSTGEIEVGYAVLCKLVYSTNASFHTFMVVVAIIEIVPLMILYREEVENAFLSVVLFLIVGIFPMLFSGLRQSIAISLGAIAFLLLKNRKIILFIIVVFFAMTFHTSAFMLFFMLPLYYLKITKKWLIVFVPMIIAMMIFNVQIFSVLVKLLPERYDNYEAKPTGAFAMLLLYVLFAIYAYIVSDESIIDKETMGLRNFLLFSIILQIFASINTVAMRMNYYYIIFIPLLLPKVMKNSQPKYKDINRLAEMIMIIFFLFYFFYGAYYGEDILQIYPYEFFWGN